jgi:hypothetical protein
MQSPRPEPRDAFRTLISAFAHPVFAFCQPNSAYPKANTAFAKAVFAFPNLKSACGSRKKPHANDSE